MTEKLKLVQHMRMIELQHAAGIVKGFLLANNASLEVMKALYLLRENISRSKTDEITELPSITEPVVSQKEMDVLLGRGVFGTKIEVAE